MRVPQKLIALSTGELREPREYPGFIHRLGLALEAGLPAVLIREPLLSATDLLLLAEQAMDLCAAYPESWCGLHDQLHVALAAGTDGVHLGWQSLRPEIAREVAQDRVAIGMSTHKGDTSKDWQGADYLFHSPVFPTPSKQGLLSAIGVEGLQTFQQDSGLPTFGLGGLKPGHVADVMASGCGVAVLSGVLGASDPAAATHAYLEGMDGSL